MTSRGRAPTTLERKALDRLAIGVAGEEFAAKVGGPKTLESLLGEGWAEDVTQSNAIGRMLRITDAGREARDRPPAPKPPRRRLRMLPPTVKRTI